MSEGLAEAAGVANQAAEEGAPDRVTLSLAEAIGTEPTVLLGMPGAFTPSCTDIHLPGYINAEGKMEAKGVEQIALLTTNDVSCRTRAQNACVPIPSALSPQRPT